MSGNPRIEVEEGDDIRLLELCLEGDRHAFEQLVTRYQGLICSMAYSACGNRVRSEDLAQETFVAAWQKLRSLRDRSKFKSWLCGIARNLINQSIRRQRRDPIAAAASLDFVPVEATGDLSPSEEMIRAEEEALVWQSLERIPETYREPLILFYREDQSINRVAEALDLTEDAVKQWLSRGRKMMKEQIEEIVEATLTRSRPAKNFTMGVIAALPMAIPEIAAASVAGAATKGGVVVKASGMGFGGALVAPLIQLFLGSMGFKMQLDAAHSARERRFTIRLLLAGIGLMILLGGAVCGLHLAGYPLLSASPFIPAVLMICFFVVWIPVCRWGGQRIKRMRTEDGTWVEPQSVTGTEIGKLTVAGVVARIAGGVFVTAVWMGALAISLRDWGGLTIVAAASIFACAGGISICLRHPKRYFQAMGVSVGAVGFVAIVAIGWRLGIWTGMNEASAVTSRWLFLATNATIISILAVNLLAWKRDADLRKRVGLVS